MRGSILHPQRRHALLVGVAATLIVVILVGSLVGRLRSLRPPRQTEISMQIAGLNLTNGIRGSVYWMDEAGGKVPVIGHFAVDGSTASMTLNVSNAWLQSDARYIGVYWPAGGHSHVPHMQFLFNPDLRKKLDANMQSLWKDPQVRDSFNELIRSPSFRKAIVDYAFGLLKGKYIPGKEIRQADEHRAFESSLRDDPFFADFFKDEGEVPSRQQLVGDSELDRAIDEVLEKMEPHFRRSLDAILWSQAEDIPNARLIWVARRAMMGSRNPAILLVAETSGSTIRDGAILPSREAP